MSDKPDDITQALLEGTLGIGEHGIAEPLRAEADIVINLYTDTPIPPSILLPRMPMHSPGAWCRRMMTKGYVDEDGAWRPKRLRSNPHDLGNLDNWILPRAVGPRFIPPP